MNTVVGKQIKYIRTKRNLSQNRFGQKIGVSAKAISAYETGKCVPSLKVLEEINNVYKVALAELGASSTQMLKTKLQGLTDIVKELEDLLLITSDK